MDRLRALALGAGFDPDPTTLRLLVDFTQAVVAAQAGLTWAEGTHVQLLAARLAARTRLPPELASDLVRLAMAPEHRVVHGPDELAAFEARFGPDARAAMEEEEQESVDLAGFARRHGSADAILLLDALVESRTAAGGISPRSLADLEAAADALGVDAVLFGALLRRHDPRQAQGEHRFPLQGDRVTIGRQPGNDVLLMDPQVAPRHASLVRVPGGWRVVDEGSGRPTVLAGEAIASAPFELGQQLKIGPYALWLGEDGDTLVAEASRAFSALSVRNLVRTISTRGREKALLSDVSFTAYSGEVVAVVGPSGCGKTTLLNAITGVAPADSGEVRLDGVHFHRLLANDRSIVGIVPQDDLVHAELTVEEALSYAGRLRFAADVTPAEVSSAVDRVMDTLDIAAIRRNRIGDVQRRGISGGQRKRVNLGQELLTRSTRILFLDEPTSGLDPRAAQDIVRLVRRLADDGRIVFLVTHDLSPAVMRQVDHLMVLAPGGHLVFFGPPDDACGFFEVPTPDALFNRLEDRSPAEWDQAWKATAAHQKYVAMREYLARSGGLEVERSATPAAVRPLHRSWWRDLATQTARYLRVKVRDRLGAAVLVAQPPLLALVMWIVFPAPTAPAVFMLALSSLWFGMSASVRELIADRAIWRRERRVGAGILPYLGSKVLVLGGIVVLQCLVLSALVFLHLDMADHGYRLWALAGVQALTGLAGMSLGLLVSAFFTSSEAAVGTLPLLLVPQITFSSIMVPLRQMGTLGKAFTWVTLQRYALDASIKTGTFLEDPSRVPGRWDRIPISGPLYSLGLKPADPDDMGLSLRVLVIAIASFIVVFLALAALLTRLRDRDRA